MENLIDLEIAAAVIPAVAFLLKFLPASVSSSLDKRAKMLLSVVVGSAIACLSLVNDPSAFASYMDAVVIGAVSGAAATGAFGAAAHIAEKASA